MSLDKTPSASRPSSRERVLDAAERLLASGRTTFSMRDLAAEAKLSFATPFNQFGSKGAIMLALSQRRIDTMRERLVRTPLVGMAATRVLGTVDVASSVMLEDPVVNRIVMAAIGAPSEAPGGVSSHSGALWAAALQNGDGLTETTRDLALATLPDQLAVAFRGALSFWTAGEFNDQTLRRRARGAAAACLLGFVGAEGRSELLSALEE